MVGMYIREGSNGMRDRYKIGEISKLYGIGSDSLRYYEKIGALHPRRDANNKLDRDEDLTEDEIPEVIRAAIFQEPEVQEVEEVNYTQTGRALDISFVGRLANGNTISAEVTMN